MNERENRKGCAEWQEWTRRQFLKRGGIAAGAAALTASTPRVTFGAGTGGQRDVLVNVFLRGAMDGLTTVAPYGDPELYLARPTLAVPPPGQTNGATDLDGFFGLAPAAAGLLPAYQAGHLAFVHASGSPDPTRSHFDAFSIMEFATPNQPLTANGTGWLARHLQTVAPTGSGDLRGVALQSLLPETFVGAPATLPISDLSSFTFPGFPGTAALRKQLTAEMYGPTLEPMSSAALSTLATVDILDLIDFAGYTPAGGTVYPDSVIGQQFRQAAALIKADVGVEAVFIERDGWDLHNDLGPFQGDMAMLLTELTAALMAFYNDMLGMLDSVTIVVMSEFGRRVAENSSLGLDHGHGNAMMVLGGAVNGGQVITQWPGLHPDDLDNGDLAITIDYRDVLAEIVEKRLGNSNLATVFPNFTPTFHGVIA